MGITFYNMDPSAPCRGPRLTAKALNLDMTIKDVDLMKGEQMTPEFLKMNPAHTVPTLDDDGFYLAESRAIQAYLADKYGKESKLYPSCEMHRALILQRMFFDMGTLYPALSNIVYPIMFDGAKEIPEAKRGKFDSALTLLDGYIGSETGYVAGEHITIADHCVIASVSSMVECGFDISKYSNVSSWFKRCQEEMPGYEEANAKGAKEFGGWAKGKMAEAGVTP